MLFDAEHPHQQTKNYLIISTLHLFHSLFCYLKSSYTIYILQKLSLKNFNWDSFQLFARLSNVFNTSFSIITSAIAESIFWYLESMISLTNLTLSAHIAILTGCCYDRLKIFSFVNYNIHWQ